VWVRQAEINGRAFADFGLGPDAPAMALDDASDIYSVDHNREKDGPYRCAEFIGFVEGMNRRRPKNR